MCASVLDWRSRTDFFKSVDTWILATRVQTCSDSSLPTGDTRAFLFCTGYLDTGYLDTGYLGSDMQ